MSRAGRTRRESSGKKEFERRLAYINCRRGFCLAVVLSIMLPCLWLFNNSLQEPGAAFTAMIIVAETIELVTAAMLFYIAGNAQRVMSAAYKLYYICTMAVLVTLSVMDYGATGSSMLYVITMGIAVFVPILLKRELRAYTGFMLIAVAAGCAGAADDGARAMADMAVVGLAAVLAGRYSQEHFRNQERVREELKGRTHYSEQDPLTGLINSRGLAERAGILWSSCMRTHSMAGIIAIDIDFFKKYNDKFGHIDGDECLKKIAEAIDSSTRGQTDVVARTGGEEFLVFVQNMSKKDIIELALNIRSAVAELRLEHAYVEVSKYVTVSMGIAYTYPDGASSFEELYEEADQALYAAKEHGRNCIVCDDCIYGRMKNGLGTAISS